MMNLLQRGKEDGVGIDLPKKEMTLRSNYLKGEAVSSDNNISEINYPVVIGLAEVENHFVLNNL
jgi:hypothetical protein